MAQLVRSPFFTTRGVLWTFAMLAAAVGLQAAGDSANAPAASPTAPSPAANATSSPIVAPAEINAPSPTSPRRRAISAAVAAQLSAATPKYTPPEPKPAPTPVEEQPDLRETDKPKNGIIRLPKYVVHERPPPVLTERAVHTQKGLADLAMRRYISETDRVLNRFTLPIVGMSAEARALAMYEEDERLRNMSDLSADAAMVSTTDKAAGAYIKREADRTFLRTSDFGWEASRR